MEAVQEAGGQARKPLPSPRPPATDRKPLAPWVQVLRTEGAQWPGLRPSRDSSCLAGWSPKAAGMCKVRGVRVEPEGLRGALTSRPGLPAGFPPFAACGDARVPGAGSSRHLLAATQKPTERRWSRRKRGSESPCSPRSSAPSPPSADTQGCWCGRRGRTRTVPGASVFTHRAGGSRAHVQPESVPTASAQAPRPPAAPTLPFALFPKSRRSRGTRSPALAAVT